MKICLIIYPINFITALKVLQECCKSNVDVNFKHADKLSLNVGG